MTVSDFCAGILRKCCLGKSLEEHHCQHFPLPCSVQILSNHKSSRPWAAERSVKYGQASLPGGPLPLGQYAELLALGGARSSWSLHLASLAGP